MSIDELVTQDLKEPGGHGPCQYNRYGDQVLTVSELWQVKFPASTEIVDGFIKLKCTARPMVSHM
jgi:hypothetical protein